MRDLPEGWVETTLGEVTYYASGKVSVSEVDLDNYISTENLLADKMGVVRAASLPKASKVNSFEAGDTLFSNIRTYFKKVWYSDKSGGASNDVLVFRPVDNKQLNKKHLYYLISNDEFIDYTVTTAKGTKMPRGDKDAIKQYSLNLPPLPEQKAIADMLSSFDEKIELLREQNKTLETLAQTIFKEWFVHFNFPDPHGKPYRNNGGAMVASELGEIPKGWRVGKLGEIGRNIRAGISSEKIEPAMKYVALEHMPRKSIALDSWVSAGKVASNKFKFKKGNILFGKLRPYFHKVGVAVISGICSTDILVIEPKKEFQKAYLLMHLSSDEFIQYVTLASEGTRMPRTSWKYMKDYTVCLPPDDIVTSFNALINNLVDKVGNNIFQIQTLSKTRDTLLPKLMSGQVRVQGVHDDS